MLDLRVETCRRRLDDLLAEARLAVTGLERAPAETRLASVTDVAAVMGRLVGFLEAAAILEAPVGQVPGHLAENLVGDLERVAASIQVSVEA